MLKYSDRNAIIAAAVPEISAANVESLVIAATQHSIK